MSDYNSDEPTLDLSNVPDNIAAIVDKQLDKPCSRDETRANTMLFLLDLALSPELCDLLPGNRDLCQFVTCLFKHDLTHEQQHMALNECAGVMGRLRRSWRRQRTQTPALADQFNAELMNRIIKILDKEPDNG